jgi:hypothetical protein
MHIKTLIALPLLFLATTAMASSDSAAEQVSSEETVKDCIWIPRIDRFRIVDEQNLLVYMRGKEIYLNEMNHRCPGMRPNKAIMYRTTLRQLCAIDTITVLDNHGFGFHRGATCGLGKFRAIDQAEAKALIAGDDAVESAAEKTE